MQICSVIHSSQLQADGVCRADMDFLLSFLEMCSTAQVKGLLIPSSAGVNAK